MNSLSSAKAEGTLYFSNSHMNSVNVELAEKLLDTLALNGKFTFCAIDDNKDRINWKKVESGNPKVGAEIHTMHGTLSAHLEKLKDLNQNGFGIFVTVNETDLKGRESKNISGIRAFFADFDEPDATRIEYLKSLTLVPTLIVETSPNKHHAYWVVRDASLDDFKKYEPMLVESFLDKGIDKGIKDLPRVLRLPGFYHLKQDSKKGIECSPFLTSIQYVGTAYSFSEFAAFVDCLSKGKNVKAAKKKLELVSDFDVLDSLNDEQITDLASALEHLKTPDLVDDYSSWLEVGMALKESGVSVAFDLWDAWSQASIKYDADITSAKWESFKRKGGKGETVRSYKSILALAQKNGWVNPRKGMVPQELPWIDTFKNGSPKATIQNFKVLLDSLGISCRYNEIKKDIEVIIPNTNFSPANKKSADFAFIESECKRLGLNIALNSQRSYLVVISENNRYNPIREWILSKDWDGKDRLKKFFGTLVTSTDKFLADGRNFYHELTYRWMLSAVHAVFNPRGIAAQGVLVLQGKQGIGKSTWFERLVDTSVFGLAELVKKDAILDPSNKDIVSQTINKWIVELGEIGSTFRKSDLDILKAFLTRNNDEFRKAYASAESCYPRMTVFGASVNDTIFLRDKTGNRRFWTIPCKNIDALHSFDMQQVWAQLNYLRLKGEGFIPDAETYTMLNAENELYVEEDHIEEKLAISLNWEASISLWEYLPIIEVLESIGIRNISNSEKLKATSYIKKRNGNRSKRSSSTNLNLTPPLLSSEEDFVANS